MLLRIGAVGVDPRMEWFDKSGWTPLCLATDNKHWEIVKLLQEHAQGHEKKHILNITLNHIEKLVKPLI